MNKNIRPSKSPAKSKRSLRASLDAGMAELVAAMSSGKTLREHFTIRTVRVAPPSRYTATSVRGTRNKLGVSQAVFAKLLGVSVELVENWEQSRSTPRATAARLLDEVRQNPTEFLQRHLLPTTSRKAV